MSWKGRMTGEHLMLLLQHCNDEGVLRLNVSTKEVRE